MKVLYTTKAYFMCIFVLSQFIFKITTGYKYVGFFDWVRYIAKTLYGDDEDAENQGSSLSIEEPKLLGLHPLSEEKVSFCLLY